MIDAKEFFGDGIEKTGSSGFTVYHSKRLWMVNMTAASQTVLLPFVTDPRNRTGFHIFFIANVGANAFNIRDSESVDPSLPISVAVGKVGMVEAYRSAGAFKWFVTSDKSWFG